jgi:2-dehydropantoate 2-reductase
MGSILIVGTGALATFFAARLSASDEQVTMLGSWHDGLEALQKEGARLIGEDGVERSHHVHATNDPVECLNTQFALVLVKSWQTERAAGQLAECLAEDGLALTLQNGLGNRETLMQVLGLQRVAMGVITSGATLIGPGVARAGGEGIISIEDHPRLRPLEEKLRAARFNVEVLADARSLVWGKLAINAAINPLTALMRIPNGELLNRPEARTLMAYLANETAAVAAAQGIKLPFEDPAVAAEGVAMRTSSNHSSMFQDISRGAPTEIDAICGAIVRTGEHFDIATPVNRVCWHLIRALTPI